MPDAPHIFIAQSRYYNEVADELISSVLKELRKAKASHETLEVPGAFEIPTAIKMAVKSSENSVTQKFFDGFIALGCVIRGETTHYDYVCSESARALQDLSVQYMIPLGYGILTVENKEQALLRAKRSGQDRGGHAARACLRMIEVKRHLNFYAE
ncbi:MAG: 6,7-dimethyl-8-ribityllumazine synthase [Pseudomonadota bacterium]|nr:6,7-dimethyl-8-ribityllumazine synthase [Pseudomonadota bacterium]